MSHLNAEQLLTKALQAHQAGRMHEAQLIYRQILTAYPEHFDALQFLGASYLQLGRHTEGIPHIQKALTINPGHAEALNNLAVALQALKRYDEAITSYRKALAIKPSYAEAHYNLGNCFREAKRYEEALVCFQMALTISPNHVRARNNLGNVLGDLQRHEEAIVVYQEVLAMQPNYADAYHNLGISLQEFRRYEEALACFQKAITINPKHELTYLKLSLALLGLGKFQEGWKMYEERWNHPERPSVLATSYPLWLGARDLHGKSLLIQEEQGFGDAIQMLRYVPLLEAKGVRCWLEADPSLRDLIRCSFPTANVISPEHQPESIDFRIPLMSLPLAMKTFSENDIPNHVPYLVADPHKIKHWAAVLKRSKQLKVGIVWRGRPTHENDRNRSMPLEILQKLFAIKNVQFVSIQKKLTDAEAATLEKCPNVLVLDSELQSFDDSAAIITNLDLLISVDTAPAHLAGALGKPVWIMLPFNGEWRWLNDKTDTAWYPTAKLFRQTTRADWSPVVQTIADSLLHANK